MKKKPSKKKSDAEFIEKIKTLAISTSKSKGHKCGPSCAFCGKQLQPGEAHVARVRFEKPKHDDSGEESLSA